MSLPRSRRRMAKKRDKATQRVLFPDGLHPGDGDTYEAAASGTTPLASAIPTTTKKRLMASGAPYDFKTPGAEAQTVMDAVMELVKELRKNKELEAIRVKRSANLDQAKQKNIQKAVYNLAAIGIGGIVVFLAYNLYILVAPVLSPLFLAFLLALCLAGIQEVGVTYITRWQAWWVGAVPSWARLLTYTLPVAVMAPSAVTTRGTFNVLLILCMLVYVGVLVTDKNYVVAGLLVVSVLLTISVPLLFFAKTCYDESRDATARIIAFVDRNPDVQALLSTYESDPYVTAARQWAQWAGWDVEGMDVEHVKQHVVHVVSYAGNHVAAAFGASLGVITNVANTLFSFVVFVGALFYMLVHHEYVEFLMEELSPLSVQDSQKIYTSLRNSVSSIFLCSLAVGLSHGVLTFVSFYLCDFELVLVFAFLSGVLAMLPILSSWIIWVPACLYLYWARRMFDCAVLIGLQLFGLYVVDPFVYGYIPGSNSYLSGMSIAMGVYSFGMVLGALVGPMLVALSSTVFDIYRKYYNFLPPTSPWHGLFSPRTVTKVPMQPDNFTH